MIFVKESKFSLRIDCGLRKGVKRILEILRKRKKTFKKMREQDEGVFCEIKKKGFEAKGLK